MNLNIEAATRGKKQKLIINAPQKKRKRATSLDVKKARAGWIFVLPFIIGFALIYLPIIFDSIRFSFNEMQMVIGGGYKLIFVGFENYRNALFVNPNFVTTLLSGIKQLILDVPSIVIFSLFVALILIPVHQL